MCMVSIEFSLNCVKNFKLAGLDGAKWHGAKKGKPEAAKALSAANGETEYEKREEVYEANREAITHEIK